MLFFSCRNYKVTTCIYVTPPKFHFYSKKPTISVFTFMLLNIRKFVRLLQKFMSTPLPPFYNNKYRLKFVFTVTYMLLHKKQMVKHQKRYLAEFIQLLQAFM